ncbi:putative exported protein [Lysobacter dokdonensis DS-58]|uniref:Putative exported protein n=1 Tax=Lysobacter dokdonensis DS-58 TaxID=1300345 RepID=A0A0A2WR01_9GAMM|nr:YhdP family protein [Lysobacter dokdonensis]KGQ20710.1 putative exported protein [Lysobacter dokdonensis DS-58]
MPTPFRRRMRHARRFVGYGALVALIFVALLVGIAKQMLPLAERHPDRIAAWLSERAGMPVRFAKVETGWTRRGPLLRLDDLRIGEGAQSVLIGDTEMLVSLYGGLLPGGTFSELRLRGLDLTVERTADGLWSVRGLPGQQQPQGSDPFAALERLGELQIIGGRLRVVAPTLGIDATVPRIDLRLRVEGDRIRSGMRAWMKPNVSPLDAALDFDRKRGDGRAYAGAVKADLGAWSPLLHVLGVEVQTGRGRAQAWAELRGHRVASITADATLDDVALRGAPLADASVPQSRFGHVELHARLQNAQGEWRFDAPKLRIHGGGVQQTLDGLLLIGGKRFGLRAERVDAGPLLAASALSDRMDAGLRRWILLAKPQAVLERVEVVGMHAGALQAHGTVSGVGFAPVGNSPGLRKLAGEVIGDADGLVFTANPQSTVDFDWPAGFAMVHPVTLTGQIALWREGAGWRVGTDSIRVRGRDFGVHARGGVWFQNDGTRPWIDIATDIDATTLPTGKGFLVRHLMPDATEHWLDMALVGGGLKNGRAIVSGDLDDWPFLHNDGLFRADAELDNASVKFSNDWPATDHLSGPISFVGNGFSVEGKGALAGVTVSHIAAGIPDFSKSELYVQAEGASDASKLLGLLRQSPLNKEHGETLANIEASGAAAVTFDMLLPLHLPNAVGRTKGTVELTGARLREKRWDLAFDDVRGKAEYGDGGFAANALSVRHAGQPGTLGLRAGEAFVRDKSKAFEADMQVAMDAKSLVDRAGNLGWLRSYIDGRSPWSVAVALPKTTKGAATPTKLMLRSNLVGTALDLPAPLKKTANASLPATIEADLPLGEGEVRVAFGTLAALRSRTRGDQTGLRVVLGSDRVDEAPPASGLIATGHAPSLDLIDWIGIAESGKGADDAKGNDMPLQRIDLRTDRLLLLGGVFPDARVLVTPGTNASNVAVSGPALVGNAVVPDAKGAAISGRMERAYWRSAAPAKTTATANAPIAPPTADPHPIDPASIPALSFDVADLRINALSLGKATIRTRPTATGMRFDTMQAQSDQHRVALTGEWNGMGAAARTRVALQMDSEDFGKLMDGLGFAGQLASGEGTAKFDATWPGAPREFGARGVDGTLALDVKKGTLLEIEPGAGRVLGLLSIAQLPRRMLLDFRDFYSKGLAFDRIDGHVRLSQGKARTDDLTIDSPAAQIEITGAADLQAQTFDQTVEVIPRAGNLLTVAGAIAGGPVGAAIGAAANAVLKKPLGQLTAKTYRVTGPWKEPKVEVTKKPAPQGRSSASADGAPNG